MVKVGIPSKSGYVLCVTNLPEESETEDLIDLFGEQGRVLEVSMVLDKRTGLPKGYAFVQMAEKGAAEDSIEELDKKEYRGQTLAVDWAFKA